MRLPVHLLPQSLREVAAYCGEETALGLLLHFGGGHVHIPRRPAPDHALAHAVGLEAMARLCAAYGGETLEIPRAETARRAVRNAAIRQARAAGASVFELAQHFGLSERQVRKILQRRPGPDGQGDLFEAG